MSPPPTGACLINCEQIVGVCINMVKLQYVVITSRSAGFSNTNMLTSLKKERHAFRVESFRQFAHYLYS